MRSAIALLMLAACGSPFEVGLVGPPHNSNTFHVDDLGREYAHARGSSAPFNCRDAAGDGGDCETIRTNMGSDFGPDNYSCDAAGCHGSYEFGSGAPPSERSLHGAEGPSCFTCHDVEWSE